MGRRGLREMEGLSPEQFEISQVSEHSLIHVCLCQSKAVGWDTYLFTDPTNYLYVHTSAAQFKEFLTTYNNVTENCFKECVHDFTSRRVTKQEAS